MEELQHYIEDRIEYVVINGVKKEQLKVKCGTPHGSMLGYFVCTNDIGQW